MKVMSLIGDVINAQHPRLMHMPVALKKLTLSRLCFDHLVRELQNDSGMNEINLKGLKVLGMDVEIVPGDGVHTLISAK